MKKVIIYSFFVLQLILILSCITAMGQANKVSGKVIDDKGNPVPQSTVTIEQNSPIETDLEGRFDFIPETELENPIYEVRVNKKGFKVNKWVYDEESREIEISLSKAKEEKIEEEVIARVQDTEGAVFEEKTLNINGTSYKTDKKGNILIKGKFNEKSRVISSDYSTPKISFNDSDKIYIIAFTPKKVIPTIVPDIPITKEELNLSVFEKYKNYFNKLSEELLAEKARIETMNAKIREELTMITNRLMSEKSLNASQRRQLNEQAKKLELQMEENVLSYQKSAERTTMLILTLKNLILEKDSISIAADKKVELAQKQETISRKKSERNLFIFSIITAAFIIFGIVFYLTYLKIRTQQIKLLAANKEINKIKNQLARNVQELKESNEQLEIFVYKASHDIKGPLRSIIGLTTIGKEDVKDPAALNYFEHILLSTKKLDKLLLDLLQVTKVKQATITNEAINFKELTDDAIASFKHLPGFEKIKINLNIQDNGKFESDQKLMHSVIQNLIENPIKYQDSDKPESFLNITINANEKGAVLQFEDNGMGIPEEMKDRVFEMFYKINEQSNGTGLGLYIVKTSVEKLNGTISLESKERKGTTFTVNFKK